MRLSDGRTLQVTEHGSPGGFPVVYVHGAIGSPLTLSDDLRETITALDLRWLCVQRPGFGASTPQPGRGLRSFARDLAELDLGRFAVLGVSAGGPYALACGAELPDAVGAVAVCSSLSPLCPPHAAPGLPRRIRLPLRAVAGHPRLAARGLDAGLGVLRAHPRLTRRVMTAGAPPADRELLQDPQAAGAAAGGLLAATAGGVRGLIDDYGITCRPWDVRPEDVAVPVHLWHGLQDRLVPPEHAWQLAAALPDCRAAFDPDEGHFFFRRRVREIVGRLVATARATRPRSTRGAADRWG